MKKKILIMIVTLIFMVSACSARTAPAEEAGNTQLSGQTPEEEATSEVSTQQESEENDDSQKSGVRIALVTDVSSVMDSGFNQAALQGIQTYSDGAGVFYSSYSTDADTEDAYTDTVLAAIRDNAELIVCVGSHFEQALGALQDEYSDIYFLLLDGVPKDSDGKEVTIAPNVHCITYREEEAGYLVGYMSVLEGYRRFGFVGGEQIPSVIRYENGYLQGINDAAAFVENGEEIEVRRWYADTFLANKEIEEVSGTWYEEGTEIIFACGGSIYESVLAAAKDGEGMLIGVDSDQSGISERFLTSATKGIDASVVVALDDFFASGKKWPEKLAGEAVSYGAKEKCISLPVQGDAWRFQNATTNEYLQLLARLRAGEITIPTSAEASLNDKDIIIINDDLQNLHSQEEQDS